MPNVIDKTIAWALPRKPVRALLLYTERQGPMLADSVTYRTLFSLFAAVLLGFSLAALWLAGNPQAWQALVDAVDAAVPGLVGPDGLIDLDAVDAPAGLSFAGAVATIGLVAAAIGAIGSLRTAIRRLADDIHDDAFWVWVLLRNLLLAIGLGLALGASAVATVLGTAGISLVGSWLGLREDDLLLQIAARATTIVVVFLLDAAVIAVAFRVLSGIKPSRHSLVSGALIGAVGLTVLQQLSGLFVGGASNNPLLASFASLIALLLWLNLSAQVILIASAYIITGVEEERDRVRARHGAVTFAQRRVKRAELTVQNAAEELRNAREAEAEERKARADAATGGA
jgi:membrane protein